jgi:hypothetical protein
MSRTTLAVLGLALVLGPLAGCERVCSRSCADLEATYGISDELCTYLVENRFDPAHATVPHRP